MKAYLKQTVKEIYISIPYNKLLYSKLEERGEKNEKDGTWVFPLKEKDWVVELLLDNNVDVEATDWIPAKKRFVITRVKDDIIEIFSDFDTRVRF